MGDRLAAGGSKCSVNEPGILQHRVIDSTEVGNARATNDKKYTAVAVFENPELNQQR